jgi:signal transduction histidine kinase
LEGLVAHSLSELQRLIGDLRPSHLDDLGLNAALRWYGGQVQERTKLKIMVEFVGEAPELSGEVKTTLFRVAQESITNVVRHAQATQANVQVTYDADSVNLRIEDDGCGFDAKKITTSRQPAWGLTGMQERSNLLGGTCVILSEPGYGTLVEVTIPLNGEPLNDDTTFVG